MQIMLVFEIQIFVHQIQPVDFWFNISYSVPQRPIYTFAHHFIFWISGVFQQYVGPYLAELS